MPEGLWQEAVELAHEHGVWATSRALGVRYESLKARLMAQPAASSRSAGGFVELAPLVPSPVTQGTTTIVELTQADGSRMMLRLASAHDVQRLVESFLRARQ